MYYLDLFFNCIIINKAAWIKLGLKESSNGNTKILQLRFHFLI